MRKPKTDPHPFKACKICGTTWCARDDFLTDPDIVIVGYQVHFDALTEGIFLFNHSCNGTLSVMAGELRDLYKGPVFQNRATGSEECPGYCLYEKELDPCPAECECAFVREIVQVIKKWPKKQGSNEKQDGH
jgi:hypothetical protein